MGNHIEEGNNHGGFFSRENKVTLITMVPGITIAVLGLIDCIINGRITEAGGGLMLSGTIFTVVGYGVAETADIDAEAKPILEDLAALDGADEIFRQTYPEAYKLLYPVSSQQEHSETDQNREI